MPLVPSCVLVNFQHDFHELRFRSFLVRPLDDDKNGCILLEVISSLPTRMRAAAGTA